MQEAVANCLPPLCAAVKEESPEYIKSLLTQVISFMHFDISKKDPYLR